MGTLLINKDFRCENDVQSDYFSFLSVYHIFNYDVIPVAPCGRRVWFFDDSYCRLHSTARRMEVGHWITWWGRLKIDIGEALSLADEATGQKDRKRKREKERKRERRRREEEKERRSSNTHLVQLPTSEKQFKVERKSEETHIRNICRYIDVFHIKCTWFTIVNF